MEVLGDILAFLGFPAKIRGTPQMKNGGLNILICLLQSDDEKKNFWKLHYISAP